MSNVKNEIRNLIEYLNQRTKEYDEGRPTITDTEWDEKYFKLKDLEDKFRIIYNDSPTQSISYTNRFYPLHSNFGEGECEGFFCLIIFVRPRRVSESNLIRTVVFSAKNNISCN